MVLNILDMNDTNVNKFNELSKKGKSILIFHASWCGHCQRLDSIWGNLINRLKSENLEGLLPLFALRLCSAQRFQPCCRLV